MILAVDRNAKNLQLLAALLQKEGFEILSGESLEEFDRALCHPALIELALVDVDGFDSRIWERCRGLCRAHIPFLLVVRGCRCKGYPPCREPMHHRCGACRVMPKPLAAGELLGTIRSLLEAL